MARFETHTVGSQFIVLPKGLKFTFPAEPEANYIDTLVTAKLKKLRIAPSGLCDDETFLRRVCHRHRRPAADRRGIRPVHGLDRPRQAGEAGSTSCSSARSSPRSGSRSGPSCSRSAPTRTERQPEGDVPLLQLAGREALQEHADGRDGPGAARAPAAARSRTPATNFYQITTETLPLTENVAQVFMGMRVQCAQCHNHPFDRWTQNDYYSFAAFFSQIGRKQGEDYRETIVFNSGGGEVTHPVGGRAMPPKFLGGEAPDVSRQGPPRRAGQVAGLAAEPLVRDLVRQPRLGPLHRRRDRRAGRRLPRQQPGVEPRAARGPGQALHRHEVQPEGPGPRHLQLADLSAHRPSATRATRATSGTSPTPLVRRIKAENLLDTISAVTDTKDKFHGLPLGARAVQIADGSTLDLLPDDLRPRHPRDRLLVRGQDGADPLAGPPPAQRRHRQRQDPAGRPDPQAASTTKKFPEERITELYVRCLSPQADQGRARQAPARSSAKGPNQTQALEDIFWALLNSREFLFNH